MERYPKPGEQVWWAKRTRLVVRLVPDPELAERRAAGEVAVWCDDDSDTGRPATVKLGNLRETPNR